MGRRRRLREKEGSGGRSNNNGNARAHRCERRERQSKRMSHFRGAGGIFKDRAPAFRYPMRRKEEEGKIIGEGEVEVEVERREGKRERK